MEVLIAYFVDLIVSGIILGVLYGLGFEIADINGGLFAAIFTVVISSATVLLTSVTDNTDLMVAAKRAGGLVYLVSAFSIPIIVSLVGLMLSIIGISFNPPSAFMEYVGLFEWALVFLVIYSALGFLGAVSIITLLQYSTASVIADRR